MITQIKTDPIVSGNGHYDIIASWFWSETKKKMIYCHENRVDKKIADDNWVMVYENMMSPVAITIKVPDLNISYFSYIMKDLKS